MVNRLHTMIDYYNEQYKKQGIRDSEALYERVLALLNIQEGETVLDVSCGEGILEYVAEKERVRVVGLDFSSSALDIARSRVNTVRLTLGDGERLPFRNETFKYVINLGSLEHYLHPEKGILEAARVSERESSTCFLLPNSYYIFDIVRILFTGYSPSHHQPLERFATKMEWQNLLQENGFRVIKAIKYNSFIPVNFDDVKWYLRHPKRLLILLTGWLTPFHLSYCFIFVCKKDDVNDYDS